MITDFLISIVSSIISFFDNLLPTMTVPSWFTTNATSAIVHTLGDFLAAVSGFLPVDAVLTVLQSVVTFLPVAILYLLFNWTWQHVPTVAGFGT